MFWCKAVQVGACINYECLSHTNDCREDQRCNEQFPERELSQGLKDGDEAQQRMPGIGIRYRIGKLWDRRTGRDN